MTGSSGKGPGGFRPGAGAKRKFTSRIIEEALRQSGGMYTIAARRITQATGRHCCANTVKNYVKRSKHLQEVYDEVTEVAGDIAESALIKNIQAGKELSIFFYLNNKCQSRGYGRRDDRSNQVDARQALSEMLEASGSYFEPPPQDIWKARE